MQAKFIKFLTAENKGRYSDFDYTEYLPRDGKPGKWLPRVACIEICESGYHASLPDAILDWMNEQAFEVEFRGETKIGGGKICGHQMRLVKKYNGWNERNLRLAACEIAKKCVKKYWNKPNDTRPMDCILVAERYANGKATAEELSAARSAAWSAARSAAWSAEGSAAWSAAWSAEGSAAGSAEGSAAWSAAWSAEGSAAWSAAWSAEGSAEGSAARKIIFRHCGIK